MNIVLEGPDGGGKTQLAHILRDITRMTLVPGEGPPKFPGEINERARRYIAMDNCIFDRHPCISQPIYGRLRRTDNEPIMLGTIHKFYDSRPLIIYCRTKEISLQNATFGVNENPEHVEAVRSRYAEICFAYDAWSIYHANMIVHDYDDRWVKSAVLGLMELLESPTRAQ